MTHLDGRALRGSHEAEADVVIVGSGPAGASAAREVARLGASVIVVEAGPLVEPSAYQRGAWGSMSQLYRAAGTSVVVGNAPIPYLQGKMVGGSSPINGAICWRLPEDVYADWVRDDPALERALPWQSIESVTDEIETRLGVAPTDPAIAGIKNNLMAQGAEALGLQHRPIRRNVVACEGLGLCMQGCPAGHKQSVERTVLADAFSDGARLISSCSVERVEVQRGRAVGVVGTAGGARVRLRARQAVILAASAVQTPALLLRSGLRDGPVGHGFSCHPGVSLAGRFPHEVRMWEGATQGHEVIGLRHEGLKFEALGFGLAILAARMEGVGAELARGLDDLAYWADWGVAIKAESRGRVRLVAGRPVVGYSSTRRDVALFRRGLRVLGELMFAAGAERVAPGVRGFDRTVDRAAALARLESEGPATAAAYTAAITHMFGTCRMGSDRARSVVGTDFRHRSTSRLYIADSSVFPTNTGVNPQVSIMAIAALCGRRSLGLGDDDGVSAMRRHAATNRSPAGCSQGFEPTRRGPARGPRIANPMTLDDLIQMDAKRLHEVLQQGHPLDLDALADTQYLGVDLSLPKVASKVLWKTFRKAFHRDGAEIRGWNVRMEQTGVEGPQIPMLDRGGAPLTFGHYRVCSARDIQFPGGWRGAHFLDYGTAGNMRRDPARLGYTPLVAVNAGSMDLLLGWEVFRVGPGWLPLPLYWALQYAGPLDLVVAPPRART